METCFKKKLNAYTKMIFIHDNVMLHLAKQNNEDLNRIGFKDTHLRKGPSCSNDLHPFENLWSILKRHFTLIDDNLPMKMNSGMLFCFRSSFFIVF